MTTKPTTAPGCLLTPIRIIGHTCRKDGRCGEQVWDCRCQCGSTWAAQRNYLRSGREMMCGKCKAKKK